MALHKAQTVQQVVEVALVVLAVMVVMQPAGMVVLVLHLALREQQLLAPVVEALMPIVDLEQQLLAVGQVHLALITALQIQVAVETD
jgi:ribosomal 30S subunit maturation factor RimM